MSTPYDNSSGPRHLLRRLHHVMAGAETGEERLGRVVAEIAKNMFAEVCSVYLLRRDGTLELFATEGLKKEAIHLTHLRVGQGLVGFVAEEGVPVSLAEASSHPRFVYLPETGEELYHSFLGVPIVRGGVVAGVLVVQNVQSRTYSDEEEEALQTVAMVLAELVGSGELVSPDEAVGAGLDLTQPQTVDGQILADGVAVGRAVFHERRLEIAHLVAEDVDMEKGRLMGGLNRLRSSLEDLMGAKDLAGKGDHHEVLDAFRMFAYDKGWQRRM
ncbi:MAG: GAF domain-containing protein, partial [Sphingomonadales bacterium]|nr:GAF domain-containing protein [Sphingomonadales bacterium]